MAGLVTYVIVGENKTDSPTKLYDHLLKNFITTKLHYGGSFSHPPTRNYEGGSITFIEHFKLTEMNTDALVAIESVMGVQEGGRWCVWNGEEPLDYGLIKLHNDQDIERYQRVYLCGKNKYVQHIFIDQHPGNEQLFWLVSLSQAPPEMLSNYICGYVSEIEDAIVNDAIRYMLRKFDVWIPDNVMEPAFKRARAKSVCWYKITC